MATVLLLASAAPADLEDWAESEWWGKVRLYAGDGGSRLASFATLPQPLATAEAHAAEADTETRAVAALIGELAGASTEPQLAAASA